MFLPFLKLAGIFFILLGNSLSEHDPKEARDIFMKMLDANSKLETGRWALAKNERLKSGKYFQTEMLAKLKTNPFKVYVYSIHPNPGAEALYVKGFNNDKVLVHPNKFPFINLSVLPGNFILREHQHHTILEIGFAYITDVLKHTMLKNESVFFKGLSYEGEVDWDKKKFYKLSVVNPAFEYVSYTVQRGEDVLDIARKFYVNEYMILCANQGLDEYDDVKAGQTIKIPSAYAKKIILYVDKTNFLPLMQSVFDEHGLFEQYEFHSFVFNCPIQPEEFSPHYKGYGF